MNVSQNRYVIRTRNTVRYLALSCLVYVILIPAVWVMGGVRDE